MSRTYRNRKTKRYWSGGTSKVAYINRQLEIYGNNEYERTWVKKPKVQYLRELEEAEEDLIIRSGQLCVYKRYVSPFEARYRKLSQEEIQEHNRQIVKKAEEDWEKFSRDGRWSETSSNTGFKKEAKKIVRRANADFCTKVMKNLDYEDTAYPNGHEGDYAVWNWW